MAAVRSNAADPAPKLADHAATAALYATDPERRRAADEALEAERRRTDSAPLPAGLTLANASAAASLAHARQKPTDTWKPERQPHAEQAALLARNYQRPVPSQPPKINPHVYKAALLAAQDRVTSPPLAAGDLRTQQSAASHLMSNGTTTGRGGARETTVVAINPGALNAASGAVSRRRPRTESAPVKPVFHQDAAYALTAATLSHQASRVPDDVLNDLDPAIEAARIHHLAKSNAQLYTSTPPVGIEVEEQKHRDTLRAAAISMAKDMYASAAAKGEADAAETAGSTASYRQRDSRRFSQSQFSWISGEEQPVTRQTPNIHEAAQKIAAEKLAKMKQNELNNQRHYYGVAPRPRPTLSRRLKRRTSSDGDVSSFDWERSEEIRNQMSSLRTRLNEIDEKKSKDRSNLMEIAQKNVNARIHDLDERVYARTGKPSPNMQREWEKKALERAEAESGTRMANFGRISVGGQKYMDESEVEAIARARIEPTLNEINDRAEEKRAKEIEDRLDRERSQRLSQLGFLGKPEPVSAEKEQKASLDQERLERKRSRKGSAGGFMARTSRVFSLGRRPTVKEGRAKEDAGNVNGTAPESEDRPATPAQQRAETEETARPPSEQSERGETDPGPAVQAPRDDDVGIVGGTGTEPTVTSPESSPKSQSKLKSWLKSKVSRRASKQPMTEAPEEEEKAQDRDTGSRGDATAGDTSRSAPLSSNPVTDQDIASSVRSGDQDPIRQWSTSTAGSAPEKSTTTENRRGRLRMSLKGMITRKPPSEVSESPLSSPTTPTAANSGNVGTAALARPGAARLNTMERVELRDSFTEGSLPPPPNLFTTPKRGSVGSSARDSKFSEDI